MVSNCVEAMDYTENDGDIQIVSDLVGGMQDAIVDYQVSGDPQTSPVGPLIQATLMAHREAVYDQSLKLIVSC